ncbi:integrase catalytic domain-containing protein [Trichonephila clavipes]|nr:integrase catalytic domain-containing protein [Trichonephila clavipes]
MPCAGRIKPRRFAFEMQFPSFIFRLSWWEGLSWLLESPSNWPIDHLACETSEVEQEKWKSIIRFVSWMLRFVENAKKKREFPEIGDLTVHEMEHAEKTLIKIVQANFFPLRTRFLI